MPNLYTPVPHPMPHPREGLATPLSATSTNFIYKWGTSLSGTISVHLFFLLIIYSHTRKRNFHTNTAMGDVNVLICTS